MSFLSDNRLRRSTVVGLVLGTVLAHRAGAGETLKVCIDQANPTATMDLRVARAAARTRGLQVEEVPFVGYGKGDDGFPPAKFSKMAQSDCALIMGFPVDVSRPNLPANVLATAPYASTGFAIVRRASAKNMDLGELHNGSEVGIAQLDTYAGLLYGTHPNIVMHVYPDESLMLADLAAGRIAAGLAWQPSIESYERKHPKLPRVNVRVLPDKHMVWNLVALYAPESNEAAALFDKGIRELQDTGALNALITPYGRASAAETQRASARWTAPHMMSAVAWDHDGGGFMKVSDAAPKAKKNSAKVPALYTEDQATKGALAYYQNCAMCHGPNLDGQPGGYSGPALKGEDFADPSYNFHVSDIFNFVSKQMPAATPGSLSHEQDVQIMAFILQQNGYPSGAKELVYEEAEKSRVPIRYHGK